MIVMFTPGAIRAKANSCASAAIHGGRKIVDGFKRRH
jgi:hypothetical protein